MIHHPLTYWLAFSHSNLAYKTSITDLLQHYRDPEHFIKDNMNSFIEVKSINWSLTEDALHWAETPQHHIITFNDTSYPEQLKAISHPPPILYIKGNPNILKTPQLAIVGSRYPTHSGREITKHFSSELVNAGFTITSGLAIGIDAASHEAAVKSNGTTIAVLGNGLHSIYPKQHNTLANDVSKQGCLVSEFPLHAKPNKKHFPQRNRIISGLSLGTLVVEAKLRSGSLITARFAAEQGREVFAIPGSIRHALSHGCHQLLRDGAVLTESVNDILDTLGISSASSTSKMNPKKQNKQMPGLDPLQQQLLACVDYEGASIDTIIERSKTSSSVVTRLLLNLELRGYISSTHRGYIRIK